MIINRWFPVNEYGLATSLVIGSTVFMVAGFYVTGSVFSGSDVDTVTSLNTLIYHCNFVVSAIFLFFMFFFKDHPDTPPSKVATETPPERHVVDAFKELRHNRNFLIVCICYVLVTAPYSAFGSIMALVFAPFGISVAEISMIGIASTLCGVVSTVVFGAVLDRTRAYKRSLTAGAMGLLIAGFAMKLVLASGARFIEVLICGILFCSVTYSMISLCMAFSAEVTYPL